MTDILALGGNSLKAYSRGLSTVSDNIANAQTPGFARRSIDMASGQVQRYADDWRENEARITSGLSAQSSARLSWLQSAEAALDDGAAGVGQQIGAVFNRATELAADPRNTARRSAFLQAVTEAAGAFRTTAQGLKTAAEGAAAQAQQGASRANDGLAALADVNQKLRAVPMGTRAHASLQDQRDKLLAQVAEAVTLDVNLDSQGGATVRLAGSGELLADASGAGQMACRVQPDGQIAFDVTDVNGAPSSASPLGGSLAGLASAARDIEINRSKLDVLAHKFTKFLNSSQAAGKCDDGRAGGDIISLGTGDALTIAALDIGTAGLALADDKSANGNIAALLNGRATAGIESGWASLVSEHAQRVASARTLDDTARARNEAAQQYRDDTSGVDLDREAVDLLRYQQSYDAAAKVIQVAREMIQSILNAAR